MMNTERRRNAEKIYEIWEELIKHVDRNFILILNHYIGRKIGMPVDIAIIERPSEFKKYFMEIFGKAAWESLYNMFISIALRLNIKIELVEDWFK